jgi:hypothetical protein
MNKGFWNGEPTATFIGVTYEVTQSDGTYHWQNRHIGQRRQGIQITCGSETWIIDNQFGDGYHKVTSGLGSPTCGHKSIFNPINVTEIPDSEINTELDWKAWDQENEIHDNYIRDTDPATYERLQGLKAMIKKGFQRV